MTRCFFQCRLYVVLHAPHLCTRKTLNTLQLSTFCDSSKPLTCFVMLSPIINTRLVTSTLLSDSLVLLVSGFSSLSFIFFCLFSGFSSTLLVDYVSEFFKDFFELCQFNFYLFRDCCYYRTH